MWPNIVNKGLLKIEQLLNEEGGFKSIETLQECFGLSILQINILKVSIPLTWIANIRQRINEVNNNAILDTVSLNENEINVLQIITRSQRA